MQDLCRQEKLGGNDEDLEKYVKMIFWLCGSFSTRWGGTFIGKLRKSDIKMNAMKIFLI